MHAADSILPALRRLHDRSDKMEELSEIVGTSNVTAFHVAFLNDNGEFDTNAMYECDPTRPMWKVFVDYINSLFKSGMFESFLRGVRDSVSSQALYDRNQITRGDEAATKGLEQIVEDLANNDNRISQCIDNLYQFDGPGHTRIVNIKNDDARFKQKVLDSWNESSIDVASDDTLQSRLKAFANVLNSIFVIITLNKQVIAQMITQPLLQAIFRQFRVFLNREDPRPELDPKQIDSVSLADIPTDDPPYTLQIMAWANGIWELITDDGLDIDRLYVYADGNTSNEQIREQLRGVGEYEENSAVIVFEYYKVARTMYYNRVTDESEQMRRFSSIYMDTETTEYLKKQTEVLFNVDTAYIFGTYNSLDHLFGDEQVDESETDKSKRISALQKLFKAVFRDGVPPNDKQELVTALREVDNDRLAATAKANKIIDNLDVQSMGPSLELEMSQQRAEKLKSQMAYRVNTADKKQKFFDSIDPDERRQIPATKRAFSEAQTGVSRSMIVGENPHEDLSETDADLNRAMEHKIPETYASLNSAMERIIFTDYAYIKMLRKPPDNREWSSKYALAFISLRKGATGYNVSNIHCALLPKAVDGEADLTVQDALLKVSVDNSLKDIVKKLRNNMRKSFTVFGNTYTDDKMNLNTCSNVADYSILKFPRNPLGTGPSDKVAPDKEQVNGVFLSLVHIVRDTETITTDMLYEDGRTVENYRLLNPVLWHDITVQLIILAADELLNNQQRDPNSEVISEISAREHIDAMHAFDVATVEYNRKYLSKDKSSELEPVRQAYTSIILNLQEEFYESVQAYKGDREKQLKRFNALYRAPEFCGKYRDLNDLFGDGTDEKGAKKNRRIKALQELVARTKRVKKPPKNRTELINALAEVDDDELIKLAKKYRIIDKHKLPGYYERYCYFYNVSMEQCHKMTNTFKKQVEGRPDAATEDAFHAIYAETVARYRSYALNAAEQAWLQNAENVYEILQKNTPADEGQDTYGAFKLLYTMDVIYERYLTCYQYFFNTCDYINPRLTDIDGNPGELATTHKQTAPVRRFNIQTDSNDPKRSFHTVLHKRRAKYHWIKSNITVNMLVEPTYPITDSLQEKITELNDTGFVLAGQVMPLDLYEPARPEYEFTQRTTENDAFAYGPVLSTHDMCVATFDHPSLEGHEILESITRTAYPTTRDMKRAVNKAINNLETSEDAKGFRDRIAWIDAMIQWMFQLEQKPLVSWRDPLCGGDTGRVGWWSGGTDDDGNDYSGVNFSELEVNADAKLDSYGGIAEVNGRIDELLRSPDETEAGTVLAKFGISTDSPETEIGAFIDSLREHILKAMGVFQGQVPSQRIRSSDIGKKLMRALYGANRLRAWWDYGPDAAKTYQMAWDPPFVSDNIRPSDAEEKYIDTIELVVTELANEDGRNPPTTLHRQCSDGNFTDDEDFAGS